MRYWTVVFGDIPEELQLIVDHNIERWGMEVVREKAIDNPTPERLTVASDVYRWQRAAEAPEPECYVDLDCKILKPLDHYAPESLPYYPLGNLAATPQPDAFIMVVSRQLAQEVIRKGEAYCGFDTYCWPRKVLRDWPGITQIDPSCYEHGTYSMLRRREMRRRAKGGQK